MKSILILAATVIPSALWAADAKPAAKPMTPEKFYAAKCSSCHGKNARGNEKMLKMYAKDKIELKDLDLLDENIDEAEKAEFKKDILDGKGKKMPSYKEKLGGVDVNALVDYIAGLKAAEETPKP